MSTTQVRRLVLAVLAGALIFVQEVVGFLGAALPTPWTLTHTIVHTVTGITYAVCAWLAWQASSSPIPGRIMITIAFIWLPPPFIATLWNVGWLWPLFESIGLMWAILQVLLVAVYPTGRFQGAVERWVLAIGAIVGLARFVVVLLSMTYPTSGCVCAPNAYAVLPNETLYSLVDKGFRLFGVVLIFFVVGAVMVRWVRGTTPARNIAFIMPAALLLWGITATYIAVAYSLGANLEALLTDISLLSTAAIPASFVAGLVFIRSLRGRVSDLMVLTRDGVDRAFWQRVLSETLRDPGLQVYWWDPQSHRYIDTAGGAVPPAPDERATAGRAMMAIDSPDGRLALIDHDIALSENRKLLDAVSTALRLSVDNGRLRAELEETLQEVRDSRVRIIEAGMVARRRIERDLHDGSQQSLVSLALSLRMAVGRARSAGQDELADDLESALQQLMDALKQLRELARGIHPSSLSVGGLGMAVNELASRSAIPVDVQVSVPPDLPSLTQSTVYFFVAECLTNIAKYAEATRASVTIEVDADGLRVSVGDDGVGGARMEGGGGLGGLVDRMEAIGGVVSLQSEPGHGTVVTASIPFGEAADAAYGIQRADEAMR